MFPNIFRLTLVESLDRTSVDKEVSSKYTGCDKGLTTGREDSSLQLEPLLSKVPSSPLFQRHQHTPRGPGPQKQQCVCARWESRLAGVFLNTLNTKSSSIDGGLVSSTVGREAARIVPSIQKAHRTSLLTNGICPCIT